jgi:hypothetical protein
MTLGDFFNMLSENPSVILFYFISVPLTAFLAYIFGRGDGDISPWKYLYSVLVFLVCIPGIFAITLSIYLFFFERISIMETNMFTQILPVISMIATLALIRKNVCFEDIPGFGKITGLIMVIAAILILMWVFDKTHIIAITFMPFYYVVIIFVVLLVAIRYGTKMMMK